MVRDVEKLDQRILGPDYDSLQLGSAVERLSMT